MKKKIKTVRRFHQLYKAFSFSELMTNADQEFLELVVAFDSDGNVIEESKFSSNGALEERNSYSYDEKGKLNEHLLLYALDDVTERRTLKRDDKGRLIEETKHYGDDTGEIFKYTYDDSDHVVSILRFDEEGDFDFREEIKYTEKNEIASRIKYDAADRIKDSVEFAWLDENSLEEKERDATGEILSVTVTKKDASGRETAAVTSGSNGKLISAVYSIYDEKGNMIERRYKDFYSKTVKYAYDESNRMVSQELFDGSGLLLRKNVYVYDTDDNLLTELVFEIDASRGGRDKHYGNRFEYEYFN